MKITWDSHYFYFTIVILNIALFGLLLTLTIWCGEQRDERSLWTSLVRPATFGSIDICNLLAPTAPSSSVMDLSHLVPGTDIETGVSSTGWSDHLPTVVLRGRHRHRVHRDGWGRLDQWGWIRSNRGRPHPLDCGQVLFTRTS